MEDLIHGVGFAIKTYLIKNLPVLPAGINKCLMKLHIPIGKSRHLTIINAYAPALTSSHDVMEEFCDTLDHFIKTALKSNKLVLLGDFNARVGTDHSSWTGVLGKHGIGKASDNSLLLLSKCAECNLCIANSLFRMADKYKTDCVQPSSKH